MCYYHILYEWEGALRVKCVSISLIDNCTYTKYTKKSYKNCYVVSNFSPSQSKSGFYAIASQMKLLVDTPEKVLALSVNVVLINNNV